MGWKIGWVSNSIPRIIQPGEIWVFNALPPFLGGKGGNFGGEKSNVQTVLWGGRGLLAQRHRYLPALSITQDIESNLLPGLGRGQVTT
jgi:hypothetical protein